MRTSSSAFLTGAACVASATALALLNVGAAAGAVGTEAGASVSASAKCRKAKRKVKQAKKGLRKARRSSNEKKIRKAKKKFRQAKRKRKRACGKGGSSQNRPPQLPDPLVDYNATRFGFDHHENILISEIVNIVIYPAIDPDGDPLTYSWTASQAPEARYDTYICAGADVYGRECSNSGPDPAATWFLYADNHGCVPEGHAVVTVSDGRGGTDEGVVPFGEGTDCSSL